MVMPIKNRKADADQWRSSIALQILAIGVANQKIDWLGEQE